MKILAVIVICLGSLKASHQQKPPAPIIPDCLVLHMPCTDAGWEKFKQVIEADQLGNRSFRDLADEINAPFIKLYIPQSKEPHEKHP